MRRACLVTIATLVVALFVGVGWWLAMISTAAPVSANGWLCAPSASYTTIQEAIDDASPGGTIRIVYGTYTENLSIVTDVTLQGGWYKGCLVRTYTDPQYTVIDGNAADHVVEITGGSTATLESLTLTNGQSDEGGGVYVSSASATLNNVVVTGNAVTATVGWSYGGGVYVYGGDLTLSRCEITYNTAEGAEGCSGAGVAVYGWSSSATIQRTEIMSNSVVGGSGLRGGGMWLDANSEVSFEGTSNLIAYNEATYGGGVYMWGNTDLEGVVIRDNHASYSGGAIVVSQGFSGGRIANNYILHNTADTYADSVFTCHTAMEIANNTIVGDLSGSAAGIHVNAGGAGGLKLTNNIVTGHAIGILGDSGASVTLANNDVWGNTTNYSGLTAGSGDMSADPEFVDPGSGDYHLSVDSPCINAGTGVEGLRFDFDGDRRTGSLLDIGADEYGSDYIVFAPVILKKFAP
jgi:hypothetical protein